MTTPAQQTAFHHLALSALVFSPSIAQRERRKHFDQAALDELAANVKDVGIVQPIVVRPQGEQFEVVAGERRVLAAKKAGLPTVPAMVHTLTDDQALDIQLIENLQREGLHPLVEAEGYEDLRKRGHSIEEIAEKVGKSMSYVYKRIELTACSPAVRKAFYEDKLDASRALLISRVTPPEAQAKALKEILEHWGGPMSYRQALEHIRREYMLRLDQAPFKTEDANLVPAAGACGKCPKNSAQQAGLFGDVSKAALCMDSVCFRSKVEASTAIKVAQAKENGQEVIVGKSADKILKHGYLSSSSGYVELKDPCYDDAKSRTYSQLLGKSFKPILIVTDEGKSVEVAKLEDIKGTLKEKGVKLDRAPSSSGSNGASANAQMKKAKAETAARREIYTRLRPLLPVNAFGTDEHVAIAERLFELAGHESEGQLQELWDPTSKLDSWKWRGTFEKRIPKLSKKELNTLILDLLFVPTLKASTWSNEKPELLERFAKAHKVDTTAVRKELAAAKKKAKGKKAKS